MWYSIMLIPASLTGLALVATAPSAAASHPLGATPVASPASWPWCLPMPAVM